MIAIGTDLCSIDRIADKLSSEKKEAFLKMIFTEEEQKIGESYKNAAPFYAGRWAAKEAVSKCLGVGFGKSCRWLDIDVKRGEQGNPYLSLSGITAETANVLGIKKWNISISHEQHLAVAFVVAL